MSIFNCKMVSLGLYPRQSYPHFVGMHSRRHSEMGEWASPAPPLLSFLGCFEPYGSCLLRKLPLLQWPMAILKVVPEAGIEPAANSLEGYCSIH